LWPLSSGCTAVVRGNLIKNHVWGTGCKFCPRIRSKSVVLVWLNLHYLCLWMRIRTLWLTGSVKAWFFWVSPPRRGQDPAAVAVILCSGSALICAKRLESRKGCIANVYVCIFRHADKVWLLNGSVNCFYCLKKALNKVKLVPKYWHQ